MFVLLEGVAGVQDVFVGKDDCGDIVDAEVDTCRFVACGVGGFEFDFTDDVQFPLVAVPDGANVLYPVDFREVNVGAGLVLAADEVRPVLLQVRAFRESDTVVVGIVFEPVFFERDRTLGPGITESSRRKPRPSGRE